MDINPIKMELDEPVTSNADAKKTNKKVYIPGRSRQLKDGEELTYDESAYSMFHKFDTVHPCLSFDTLADDLGSKRGEFPMSCYLVAGTEAEKVHHNGIIVMKLTNLTKNKQSDENDEDESSSSDESDADESRKNDPNLLSVTINHHGSINRIRATNISGAAVCATWNSLGKVQIWSLASALRTVDTLSAENETTSLKEKPLFSFSGHNIEGYALDWSTVTHGKLASGDNRKNIHLWQMIEGGTWAVDQRALSAHKSSVEDLQWSPTEDNVLASCSSDKTIRLWDCRVSPNQACICTVENAHDGDVNVISWNAKEPLLLSGGDDCALKIWDLKFIQAGQPVALFKHHSKSITSVHWYKHDSTVFAAAGSDNQVTVWDLAVEADDEGENTEKVYDVPPQMMFIHAGQEEIKEIRWHPQLSGTLISTALDGFNIFKPMNM